jgi:surfactin synthase thioesterase subunit
VALQGYQAFIVTLPRRGAFGGAEDPTVRLRVAELLQRYKKCWVLGGHSRGGVVTSQFASERPNDWSGVVLIGTSHPRDVDLSGLTVPVTKIAGTRDGLASRPEVEANRAKLPASTHWVWVEGGNHSQFGWYGFQPLDRPAEISAADQREQMIVSVLEVLRLAALSSQCQVGS